MILSLFCKRRSSYFFAKTHTWSERLRLILQSFLKLESFGYNNNKGDFINQQYLRKRCRKCYYYWSLVHKEVSPRRGWKLPWQKWLKIKVYIVNHTGNVHDKAVSDVHYFKFFIPRSVVITIEKVRGTVFGFVQVRRVSILYYYHPMHIKWYTFSQVETSSNCPWVFFNFMYRKETVIVSILSQPQFRLQGLR